MNSYIPTTEEVLERYCCDPYSFEFPCNHEREKDFYQWLKKIKADVYDEALQDLSISPVPLNPYRNEK